jgi:hypothetical protein
MCHQKSPTARPSDSCVATEVIALHQLLRPSRLWSVRAGLFVWPGRPGPASLVSPSGAPAPPSGCPLLALPSRRSALCLFHASPRDPRPQRLPKPQLGGWRSWAPCPPALASTPSAKPSHQLKGRPMAALSTGRAFLNLPMAEARGLRAAAGQVGRARILPRCIRRSFTRASGTIVPRS